MVPPTGDGRRDTAVSSTTNSARQSRRRRPARPVPSPVGRRPRDRSSFPVRSVSQTVAARLSRTCHGGTRPDRTSRCGGTHWRVHGPAAGRCGAARSCPGAGLQATARCATVSRWWNMCVKVKQVNISRLGAPGNLQPPSWRTRPGRRGCAWRTTRACGSWSGLRTSLSSSSSSRTVRQVGVTVASLIGEETLSTVGYCRPENSEPLSHSRVRTEDAFARCDPIGSDDGRAGARWGRARSLCIREAAASRPASKKELMSRRPPRLRPCAARYFRRGACSTRPGSASSPTLCGAAVGCPGRHHLGPRPEAP